MMVYGCEIPEHVIDHALSQMEIHRGFDALGLSKAIAAAGGPMAHATAYRCADRVLQKLRKKGAIAFGDGLWKALPTPPSRGEGV